MIETNEVLQRLPRHLLNLVIDQPYNDYTPQDQAVWRYIMRQNVRYLKNVAHSSYLEGLKKTGISINSIPHMYGMNRILKNIGWAAVAVDGFIPPAAFMEFQAHNVLVIAADIRPIHQIAYTPAPDIVHEAAGHAPIIAHPEYADYLRRFGELGAKAFSSKQNHAQYTAIRHLSILKADPYSTPGAINKAEQKLKIINENMGPDSEMTRLRNLHWWTVEYGLIGSLEHPKIYGAGLLSSIGESYSALQSQVKKIPYSLAAAQTHFDITTRQPQLFVTPDFARLNTVLNEFARGMAINSGGPAAIQKAIRSGTTATIELSSGLQICGTFVNTPHDSLPGIELHTTGSGMFCYNNRHLKPQHKAPISNISMPVGKLKQFEKPIEYFSAAELQLAGIIVGKTIDLEYSSGIRIEGQLEGIIQQEGKNLLLAIRQLKTTTLGTKTHQELPGIQYIGIGERIRSAFAGPADPEAFNLSYTPPKEKTHKIQHNSSARQLHYYYQQVRDIRNQQKPADQLQSIWHGIQEYQDEWLLPLEILEILVESQTQEALALEIRHYLTQLAENEPSISKLVCDGLTQLEPPLEKLHD